MKSKFMKWSGLFFLVIMGLMIGICFKKNYNRGVIFRIGQFKVDYDLYAGLEFLKYNIEKAGFKVVGNTYTGELYPEKYNNASVDIFVRGYRPFYDLRMHENAKSIYYIHRDQLLYKEEFRNFDYYLTPQKKVFEFIEKKEDSGYFDGGAVPHEALTPKYDFDVLYIYETKNDEIFYKILSLYKVKYYDTVEFMQLSQIEREKLLAQAKLVMYYIAPSDGESADYDHDYVPYAVYDIISYGRPLVTNENKKLKEQFGEDNIVMFENNVDSVVKVLKRVFIIPSRLREKRALENREKLLLNQEKAWNENKGFWQTILQKK